MEIELTDSVPSPPTNADFSVYIDFAKGSGSPTRVFEAASQLIQALQALDQVLVKTVDASIKPEMVLEDLETGSLKIWLRNVLMATDDQALKDIDWKPLVGKYLVRSKYALLRWINNNEAPKSLPDLRKELTKLAAETNVRHLPDYAPPNPDELISSISKIEDAKSCLEPQDRLVLNADGEEPLIVNLDRKLPVEALEDLATKETHTTEKVSMILIVKKPDYLGASKWELRLGKQSITARIQDISFLEEFQNRKKDVRPGDALRCEVTQVIKYGFDNDVVSQSFVITKVIEVLEDRYSQDELL